MPSRVDVVRPPARAPGAPDAVEAVVDVRWPRGDLGLAYQRVFCATGPLDIVPPAASRADLDRARAERLLRNAPTAVLSVVVVTPAAPTAASTTAPTDGDGPRTPPRRSLLSRLAAVLLTVRGTG